MIDSDRGQKMLSYQPAFFQNGSFVQAQSQAVGVELDDWRTALNEILSNFYVRTATWNLSAYESELGLPPGDTLTDAERQDRIVSRLRGYGTATIGIVKQVAESYDKGSIEPVEDFAAYTIHIEFVDTRGTPPNISDLQAAVRAVVPAHIDIIYQYRYTLYQDLDENYTYSQMATLTYGDLKTKLPA